MKTYLDPISKLAVYCWLIVAADFFGYVLVVMIFMVEHDEWQKNAS